MVAFGFGQLLVHQEKYWIFTQLWYFLEFLADPLVGKLVIQGWLVSQWLRRSSFTFYRSFTSWLNIDSF